MEEIAKLVSKETGVPEDVALKVIQALLPMLEDKLPAPFDKEIEGILSGKVDAEGLLSGLLGGSGGSSGGLGSMLGSLLGGRGKK